MEKDADKMIWVRADRRVPENPVAHAFKKIKDEHGEEEGERIIYRMIRRIEEISVRNRESGKISAGY